MGDYQSSEHSLQLNKERLNAERQLLAYALLVGNDFLDQRHWAIWYAICDIVSLNGSDVAVDFENIVDALKDNDNLEMAGGVEYIAGLIQEVESISKKG